MKLGNRVYRNEYLSYGDYNNNGSVGVANVRALLELAKEHGEDIESVDYQDLCAMERALKGLDTIPADPGELPGWPTEMDRYEPGYGYRYEPVALPTANILEVTAPYGHVGLYVRCDDDAPEWLRSLVAGLAHYPILDEEVHSEVTTEWEEEAADDLLHEWTRRLDYPVPEGLGAETFWSLVRREAWYHENSSAYLDDAEQDRVYPLWREVMFRAAVTELVADLGETTGTDLTIGTDDLTSFGYQTGDNSFTGGAYRYRHWGVTSYDSSSDPEDVARDLVEQVLDALASE